MRFENRFHRSWKTRLSRVIFFIAMWIISLFAALFLFTIFIAPFFSNPTSPNQLVSLDWSGYVVISDYSNPQPVVTSVQASWTVPRVNVSQKDSFSAAWIGIGGQLDDTLIQTGTEQDSVGGKEQYSAWYELLPYDSVPISTIDVSWGDNITASITLIDSVADVWSVQISDLTTGQSFQQNFFYSSSRLSAEWIVERITVNNSLSTLANFGSVTFTNASATISSTVGTINDFSFIQVTLQNRQNIQLVTVSSLSSDGSSFTVTYIDSPDMMQNQLSALLKCHDASALRKLQKPSKTG